MAKAAKVICRCRKVCTSFSDWEKHLKAKHPRWHKELESNGDLAEDKTVFREVRDRMNR